MATGDDRGYARKIEETLWAQYRSGVGFLEYYRCRWQLALANALTGARTKLRWSEDVAEADEIIIEPCRSFKERRRDEATPRTPRTPLMEFR